MDFKELNYKYVVFLQSNNGCCSINFRSNKLEELTKKYKTKNINLIFLDNLNDIKNIHYDNKTIYYDELDIPKFGELYILFDVISIHHSEIINYYSYKLFNYKLKYYTHNFLIYLAQSFGAEEITWNYHSKTLNKDDKEVSMKVGYESFSQDVKMKNGNVIKNEISNKLTIKYDNNGSEIYFQTLQNKFLWIYDVLNDDDIDKLKLDSNSLKNMTNKIYIENFLLNNSYFSYDFYMKNEFLLDFIRKRQCGMSFINQEILFNNSHKTIYEYYLELGSDLFSSIGSSYKTSNYESNYDKNIYEIKFYDTLSLENKTINNLMNDKSIKQLKRDILDDFNLIKRKIKNLYNYDIIGNSIQINILLKIKKYHLLNNLNDFQICDYMKNLLLECNDHNRLNEDYILFYLNVIPDDFFLYICKLILNSYLTTQLFNKLLNDICILTSKYTELDKYTEIKFITESQFSDNDDIINKILNKLNYYDEYKNIEEHQRIKEFNKQYEDIESFELINKPNGSNYANCCGVYTIDTTKFINKKPVYISLEKQRFIGYSGGIWVLTGCQWLEALINESIDGNKNYGGFHNSINSDILIGLSKWKEYDLIINHKS